MKIDDRKAAIAAYKTRNSAIYPVRGAPAGWSWIGQTLNLETIQNRIWFSLRAGGHSNRELQRAWAAHGPDAFAFKPLEQLKDEEWTYVRDNLLKGVVHRRSSLNGSAI